MTAPERSLPLRFAAWLAWMFVAAVLAAVGLRVWGFASSEVPLLRFLTGGMFVYAAAVVAWEKS
jgi:hypothetical protein